MVRKIQIYDEDVKDLLVRLDNYARDYDCKFGLPLKEEKLQGIIYSWVHSKAKKDKKEKK